MVLPLEDALQKEYITNLQQQIYFLELEARLLREGDGHEGKAAPPRNGFNHPNINRKGNSNNSDNDNGFEEHIREARLKYQTLEDQFEQQMSVLRKSNDDLSLENQNLLVDLARYRETGRNHESEIANLAARSDSDKANRVRAIIELQQQLETVSANFKRKQSEVDQLKEKHRLERVERSVELQTIRSELDRSRAAVKSASDKQASEATKLVEAESRLLELQERYQTRFGSEDDESKQHQTHLAEVEDLRLTIKRMELDKQSTEAAYERRQQQCDEYLKEIAQLKVQLLSSQSRQKRRDPNDDSTRRAQKWNDELASLRHQVQDLEDEANNGAKRVQTLEEELSQLRRSNALMAEENADLLNDNLAARSGLEALESDIVKLNSTVFQLETDKHMLNDQLADVNRTVDDMKKQLESAICDRDKAQVLSQRLKTKVDLRSSIEKFKIADFNGLMSTNMEMIKNLETIANKIEFVKDSDL